MNTVLGSPAISPTKEKLFRLLLPATLLMACFALVIPWISSPQLSQDAWHASFALSVLTLVTLPFALVLFGKRAAWFLVCVPLALYWPVLKHLHN
jgi:hypothetical protein